MRFRKLRIAFSVTCAIACVLLIVLWVRSYWKMDVLQFPGTRVFGSGDGEITTFRNALSDRVDKINYYNSDDLEIDNRDPPPYRGFLGFGIYEQPVFNVFVVPYWFPCLLLAILALAPWFRWRFTLRTLLIATTLIALVLGAIVYATR